MTFEDDLKRRKKAIETNQIQSRPIQTKPSFGDGENITFGLNQGRPVNEGANAVDSIENDNN